MNYGNTFLVNLRYLLSSFGILKTIRIIIKIFQKKEVNYHSSYEKKFTQTIFKNIENNIIVWDVGAHEGHYIRKFLKNRKVYSLMAFEPTPYFYKLIKYKFLSPIKKKRLFVYKYALANKTKKTFFWIHKNKQKSVENSLYYQPNASKIIINQKKPDELVNKKKLSIPNLIKLDIEGGELKFLEGSKKILQHKNLKHLFIEVHFAKLMKLHGKSCVHNIIQILKDANFKITWIDKSHLHAQKN